MKGVIIPLLLLLPFLSQKGWSSPLATVNQSTITEETFRDALDSLGSSGQLIGEQVELKERFLQHLIDTEIRAQAAKSEGIHKRDEFRRRMRLAETQILASLYTESLIRERTNESSLRHMYEREKTLFIRKSVRLSGFFFKTIPDAERFIREVSLSPQRFHLIAKQQHAGISPPEWAEKGSHPTESERIVFNLKKGQFSTVLRAETGFYVVRLEDVTEHPHPDFEHLKADVRQFMERSVKEELSAKLRQKAKITINTAVMERISAERAGS